MIDTLMKKIKQTGAPVLVGLDPTYVMIPGKLKREMLEAYGKTPRAVAEMFYAFNRGIIDAAAGLAPAVKPQIAMYERYGLEGIECYLKTVAYAKEKGLSVIGDIKRGDISSTAAAYAAHIGGVDIEGEYFDPWKEDAVTVNPYLGTDGITPFLECCERFDKGIFVLVKTSNPSGVELQDRLIDGEPLYCRVADLVETWGSGLIGENGYSKVGAVVGGTYPEQGAELRSRMPHTFFLVPGYGAQGGKGKDLKGYFDANGEGAIVNSSRGIIAAYQKVPGMDPEAAGMEEVQEASRNAILAMREDLQACMG